MIASSIEKELENVSGQFTIIAIRPLKGCSPHILKNLQEEQWYYFYNNYCITNRSVEKLSVIPEDYYSLPRKVKDESGLLINVCAVVGKNGDGKSALIELFIRAINNFAQLVYRKKNVRFIPDLHVELCYAVGECYFLLRASGNDVWIDVSKNNQCIGRISKANIDEEFLKRFFFYSMVVNYSHYAYNINDFYRENVPDARIGKFLLNDMFHKNDGYQTPVVLNPFRDNGNVDINNENYLAKSRLITLFLNPENGSQSHFRVINQKQEVAGISYCYSKLNKLLREKKSWEKTVQQRKKTLKFENRCSFKLVEGEIREHWEVKLKSIFDELVGKGSVIKKERIKKKTDKAVDYLIYKTISISRKYDNFKKIINIGPSASSLNEENLQKKLPGLIDRIWDDGSHITLKVRQTVAFILFDMVKDPGNEEMVLDLDKYSLEINRFLGTNKYRTLKYEWEAIDLLPPPIFDTVINLKPVGSPSHNMVSVEKEDGCFAFSSLSSGEKQQIFSVSSILYHLRNLDSVAKGIDKRIFYPYINIILEEIELYFHPELQRQYIQYLLESISKIDLLNIKGINICFVTHSPFILSDLPDSNVLFLKQGNVRTLKSGFKTLGSNIHEMLANGFFMDYTIGEHVRRKIESLVQCYQNFRQQEDLSQEQAWRKEFRDNKAVFDYLKDHIGENYLKNIVSMYVGEMERADGQLDELIRKKERELEKLKMQQKAKQERHE